MVCQRIIFIIIKSPKKKKMSPIVSIVMWEQYSITQSKIIGVIWYPIPKKRDFLEKLGLP